MYRDVWRKVFGTELKIHTTHQAREDTAEELIKQSKRVVFGGGGILYYAADRENGYGEFNIFMRWYEKLKRTNTPYAFASIGIQTRHLFHNKLSLSMNISQIDNGAFTRIYPIVKDAEFVSVRSPWDALLLQPWNSNIYYYPDLCFTLRKLGLANAVIPKVRTYALTIGRQPDLPTIMAEIKSKHLRHFNVIISESDLNIHDFSKFDIDTQIVNKQYVYEQDSYFANANYVYSTRYHGMIMAKLFHVPNIVIGTTTKWKLMTFQDEADNEAGAFGHIELVRRFVV